MTAGFGLKTAVEALPAPGVLQDIQAAIDHAAQAGKVGIVGYCWAACWTWRAACTSGLKGLSAAVPLRWRRDHTRGRAQSRWCQCWHFGDQDHWIPLDTVEAF